MENLVFLGFLVRLAFLASLVVLVQRECRELMAHGEIMDPKDQRVHQVLMESRAPVDHGEILEMLDLRYVWLVYIYI